MKKTVIFDLDGTLLDTLDDLRDSVNYVMERHGFPMYSKDAVRNMVGNGVYVLLEQAVPNGSKNPLFDQCLQEFREYYKEHMKDKTAPFPGILTLLKDLEEKGYLLAVVSNKFDTAVKGLCRDYFGERIPVAIGESAAIKRKPAPDTVFEAMKELQVLPENCVYVGDSEVDIRTAENAGIPCVCVSWGFRSKACLAENGANLIAETTEELKRKLEAFN